MTHRLKASVCLSHYLLVKTLVFWGKSPEESTLLRPLSRQIFEFCSDNLGLNNLELSIECREED